MLSSGKPSYDAVKSDSYGSTVYPTVSFAVVLNIPDELFHQAEHVAAELNIAGDEAQVEGQIQGSVIALRREVNEDGTDTNQ